jgi:uncharacterized membrane protein YphA (DoxX/SURF4 family)
MEANKVDERLNRAWWLLRIGLGVGPILAGLDKFFNALTNWEMYLNPLAPKLLHIQPSTFMHLAGVVEIVAGVAVLTKYTRYAAYVVMIWLWCIAGNLVSQGMYFDIAVRDIEISLGAFALAKLSEVRGTVTGHSTKQVPIDTVRRSVA